MIEERIDFDSEGYHHLLDQYVLKLKNVYLAQNGYILDEDFNLIDETTQIFSGFNEERERVAQANTELIKNSHRIIELEEDADFVYFLSMYNIYPYGHIMDHLQPLIKIDTLNLRHPVILKNRTTGHCTEIDKHLKYFGYENNRVLTLDHYILQADKQTKLYKIKTLWYSSLAASLARWDSNILERVRDKYPRYEKKPTKLYLSRGTGSRHVINEDEVANYLKSQGYTVLYGNEPLEQMIQEFTGATEIIFYHGSMIKNILFSEDDPRILEYCSVNRPDVSFVDNARQKGITDYKQVIIDCDGKFNVQLNLDEIKEFCNGNN
jgi:capsular polysaccharide biosynthesis protein